MVPTGSVACRWGILRGANNVNGLSAQYVDVVNGLHVVFAPRGVFATWRLHHVVPLLHVEFSPQVKGLDLPGGEGLGLIPGPGRSVLSASFRSVLGWV